MIMNMDHEDIQSIVSQEEWYTDGLAIVVVGASGDLAKKKTYPSLFQLFTTNLLPTSTIIWGYARTPMTHQELRDIIRPFLEQTHSNNVLEAFLMRCYYKSGNSYGDTEAWTELIEYIHEQETQETHPTRSHNRLFYLAVPPNVFAETGVVIKQTAMASQGWSRIIIEKPFGRDLESYDTLSTSLATQFQEHHLYRIDHYLGKEIVQNLLIWRFSNIFESLWNRDSIQSVIISFKEPFGTEGRGGYFDSFGIIRDVLQNHLLQVLMLLAMEPPLYIEGPDAAHHIRDCKTRVLFSMPPIPLEDCLLGQYEGYADDPSIDNKDTNCPTYAALRTFINTPRWSGVPFILEAGKALNERKCEICIQFRAPPAAKTMFATELPRNELVMRLQPNPAIFMKANIKSPGFASQVTPVHIGVDYNSIVTPENNPDAYTRLILDVLRGRQGSFVRDDELRRSWELFTPLLHKIEQEHVRPEIYQCGTEGPMQREAFLKSMGVNIDGSDQLPMQAKM